MSHAPHRSRRSAAAGRVRGASRPLRAVLAIVLPAVALGAVATLLAPPRFTAEAVIQIEPNPIGSDPSATTRIGVEHMDAADFHRQVRLLASSEIAERVIAELELGRDVLHAPTTLFEVIEQQLSGVLSGSAASRTSEVRAYAEHLEIHPNPREQRVRVAFTTGDPVRASEIANAHARVFAEVAHEQGPPGAADERRLLEDRLERAAQDVAEARAALDAHRTNHDIASIEMRSNAVISRLSQLDRRHLEAQAERLRLDAQIELIEADQFDKLPSVTASDLIWHLKETVAQLRAQRARLQAEFRPDADQLSAVEARLRGVRKRLGARIDAIVAEIRAEHAAAVEAEEAIRAQLEEQRARAEALESAVNGYSGLEHDLVSHQRHHRELEQQLQTLLAATPGSAYQISLVRSASPAENARRVRPTALATALFFGLCGGLLLALRVEWRRPGFRNLEQVEDQLGLPALGALPDFRAGIRVGEHGVAPGPGPGAGDAAGDPERALIRQQGMEAFHEIRTRILAAAPSDPPCSLLFAGATAGAGTTSVALNIAALLSQLNKPVLVIDADFRRARCHEVLRADNEIGLTDVLCKRAEPFEAIRAISEHLSLLPAGPLPPDPTKLLASTELAECLITLQKHYAYIIVDGPPILPDSDSLLLSPLFDGVILVADQPSSAHGVVDRAAEALRNARARTLGVVVNRAPFPPPSPDAYA